MRLKMLISPLLLLFLPDISCAFKLRQHVVHSPLKDAGKSAVAARSPIAVSKGGGSGIVHTSKGIPTAINARKGQLLPKVANMSVAGPFGLFSTGTNYVCAMFKKNGLDNDIGGCNMYRQKHKPPAVVQDFTTQLASVKYYRIWLHTFVEILLRRNETSSADFVEGFSSFYRFVNNDTCFGTLARMGKAPGDCCTVSNGPRVITSLYNRTLATTSWATPIKTEEGRMSLTELVWQLCAPSYRLVMKDFMARIASARERGHPLKELSLWRQGDPKAKACWAKRLGVFRCLEGLEQQPVRSRSPYGLSGGWEYRSVHAGFDMSPFRWLYKHDAVTVAEEPINFASDAPNGAKRMAPGAFRLEDKTHRGAEAKMLLLVLVRHPLQWLLSMLKESYMLKCAWTQARRHDVRWLRMPCTLRFHIAGRDTYANPLDVWNSFHRGYLKYLPPERTTVVRYEDLVLKPFETFNGILAAAGRPAIDKRKFSVATQAAKTHGRSGNHASAVAKIKRKPFLSHFTREEIAIACSLLDQALLKRYHYAGDCSTRT